MRGWAVAATAAALVAAAPARTQEAPLSPADSDPVKMGWMQGSPVPADRQIRFEDGSSGRFPQIRWSFAHYRELYPTARVSRGSGPVAPLPVALRPDLARLKVALPHADRPVPWFEALDGIYGDAVLVLHRGRIVFEKYNGVMNRDQPHIGFSMTKSLYGTLAETLIAEGKIDERQTVAHYLPELAGSGLADATVRQLLDMTTSLDFNEDTDEGNRKFGVFLVGAGLVPPPSGYAGPRTSFEALSAVRKVGEHGQRFDYQSVTTETLGLIVARVSGKRSDVVLSERIWSQLGAEHDADIVVDRAGTPIATAGLSATLRDFARFGEMIRRGGFFNGRQIVPRSVVAKIRAGGRKSDFASALFDYDTRRGWSYHSQWWVRHNPNGAFMAIGAYGQTIYIDPAAEMVVVRFTSNPVSSTVGQDVVTLPVFDALAAHLITTASPRGSKSSR